VAGVPQAAERESGSGPPAGPAQQALAARDARQALLEAHRPAPGAALVALALNVPGPEREPPGALALFSWALARLALALPGVRPLHSAGDALGPFTLLQVEGDPAEVKRACLAIEEAVPSARLLDLDVYDAAGRQLGRAALGLPPRPCLACAAPAVECIRLGRHPLPELLDRVRALLDQPGL
jgi:holo-ACP synthase CitX